MLTGPPVVVQKQEAHVVEGANFIRATEVAVQQLQPTKSCSNDCNVWCITHHLFLSLSNYIMHSEPAFARSSLHWDGQERCGLCSPGRPLAQGAGEVPVPRLMWPGE